jgi:glycosyltransferase involved in cell wall biosynthesis
LVDPLDVGALARAIVFVLEDGRGRDLLIESGHTRVAEFSWNIAAELTYEVYRRAMGRSL